SSTLARMADNDIQVSLFIDPDLPQVEAAARLGAPMIELHTGCFANNDGKKRTAELARLKRAAELAHSLGIQVNAGHGINYQNLEQLMNGVPHLHELNIGHTIVSRALFVGLEQAVREMRQAIDRLS
ncbi:pyridoxine 5'-phosphate synthase, partial [Akkermansia sp.]